MWGRCSPVIFGLACAAEVEAHVLDHLRLLTAADELATQTVFVMCPQRCVADVELLQVCVLRAV